MKYIKIKNKGEMETQALTLLGASTKVNDETKIGQFGSGNKYALAYFLRNDYPVTITSGTRGIEITTKEEIFRDEVFNIIYINGEKTSITTQMGKGWEYWQAMREIYCNAMDEGGYSIDFVSEIEAVEGETHFYIEAKDSAFDFMQNFDDYFATKKEVLFECSMGRILKRSGDKANIYRRGIRCFNSNKDSIFDYDFKNMDIDENRLVKYFWEVERKIWELIYRCDNEAVIMEVLHKVGNSDYLEGNISEYTSITSSNISDVFKECLNKVKLAPSGYAGMLKPDEQQNHLIIPTKIYKSIRPQINDENVGDAFKLSTSGELFREIEFTKLQRSVLRGAHNFLKECEFEIPYEVKLGIFDNKDILGLAHKGEIIVSDVCIEMGVNEVVNTVIEEFIHLKYGCEDKTRKFQTSIIAEFIGYMKQKNAYII